MTTQKFLIIKDTQKSQKNLETHKMGNFLEKYKKQVGALNKLIDYSIVMEKLKSKIFIFQTGNKS